MPLENPENEIRGASLVKEELEVLTHILHSCPYHEPKKGCPIERSIRGGNNISENTRILAKMLKTADGREQLKILLGSHASCAKDRAEEL